MHWQNPCQTLPDPARPCQTLQLRPSVSLGGLEGLRAELHVTLIRQSWSSILGSDEEGMIKASKPSEY